jgi:thiol:disulfide interchange protein DsbC
MREGKAAKSGSSCNTDAIDESRKLGLKLRVGSTPTIFFAGGRRVTGAIDAAQIEARLAPAQTAGAGN